MEFEMLHTCKWEVSVELLWKEIRIALREYLGCIMQIFPHREVDMWGRVWKNRFRGAWQSLNFEKEYLFGFETLVFATSGILSMHNQLSNTPKRKENLKSHHMTPLKEWRHFHRKSVSMCRFDCEISFTVCTVLFLWFRCWKGECFQSSAHSASAISIQERGKGLHNNRILEVIHLT